VRNIGEGAGECGLEGVRTRRRARARGGRGSPMCVGRRRRSAISLAARCARCAEDNHPRSPDGKKQQRLRSSAAARVTSRVIVGGARGPVSWCKQRLRRRARAGGQRDGDRPNSTTGRHHTGGHWANRASPPGARRHPAESNREAPVCRATPASGACNGGCGKARMRRTQATPSRVARQEHGSRRRAAERHGSGAAARQSRVQPVDVRGDGCHRARHARNGIGVAASPCLADASAAQLLQAARSPRAPQTTQGQPYAMQAIA
jgi:hypothetical protein